MTRTVIGAIRRLIACPSGGVAVSSAVLLTLLVGITGLGAEASLWFQSKRSMQGAADAAAISAALALNGTGSGNSGTTCTWTPGLHGLSVAAENGWQHSLTNGVTVQVVSPPTKSGSPLNGNSTAVEQRITQAQSIPFRAVDNITGPRSAAYAIAQVTTTSSAGGDCVLALANEPAAITVSGNGKLQARCGIAADGGRDQNVSG